MMLLFLKWCWMTKKKKKERMCDMFDSFFFFFQYGSNGARFNLDDW